MPIQLMNDDDRIVVTDADLVAGGDADTTYTLRPLTRDVRKRMVKAHTAKRPNPRTHAMEDATDHEAVGSDLVDFALIAWTGILWNGEPAPCEREFKLKLDDMRLRAILEAAGLSRIVEADQARGESFRATP